MQLSSIKSFLEKYSARLDTEDEKKEKIIQIFLTVARVQITPQMIVVENGILKINTSSVVKNELFIYKEKLLSALHESGRTDIFEIN